MIKERVKILLKQGVISEEVAIYSNNALAYLLEKQFVEEKLVVYLTHLSMASQRVIDGKTCEQMPESILSELQDNDYYSEAVDLNEAIMNLGTINFPTQEIDYFILHLVNVLAN
ncbi:MAG: PRD domain-containing protein [Erysipelotrichaceae bacterium]